MAVSLVSSTERRTMQHRLLVPWVKSSVVRKVAEMACSTAAWGVESMGVPKVASKAESKVESKAGTMAKRTDL